MFAGGGIPAPPAPVACIGHHLCYKWSQRGNPPTCCPPPPPPPFLSLFPASSSQSRGTQTRGEDVTNSESLKPDNLSATVLYYFIACMQNNLMASACVALCLAPHMRSKSAPPPPSPPPPPAVISISAAFRADFSSLAIAWCQEAIPLVLPRSTHCLINGHSHFLSVAIVLPNPACCRAEDP